MLMSVLQVETITVTQGGPTALTQWAASSVAALWALLEMVLWTTVQVSDTTSMYVYIIHT